MHATVLLLLALVPPVQHDPPKRNDGTDVWAVGYAMSVIQNCPGWTMADQNQLHRQGILPKADFGSRRWQEIEDALRAGMNAAEATRSDRPDLCNSLPAIDAARWKRLAPILRRLPASKTR